MLSLSLTLSTTNNSYDNIIPKPALDKVFQTTYQQLVDYTQRKNEEQNHNLKLYCEDLLTVFDYWPDNKPYVGARDRARWLIVSLRCAAFRCVALRCAALHSASSLANSLSPTNNRYSPIHSLCGDFKLAVDSNYPPNVFVKARFITDASNADSLLYPLNHVRHFVPTLSIPLKDRLYRNKVEGVVWRGLNTGVDYEDLGKLTEREVRN